MEENDVVTIPAPEAVTAAQVPTLAGTIRLWYRLLKGDRRLQWALAVLLAAQVSVTSLWEFLEPKINERLGLVEASEFFPFTALDGVAWLVFFLFAAFLQALLLLVVAGVYRASRWQWSELAVAALGHTPAMFVVLLITTLASMVGMLFCIIPGIVFMAFLSLAPSRLALGGDGPLASLGWSLKQPEPVRYLLLRNTAMFMAINIAMSLPLTIVMMSGNPDWESAPGNLSPYLGVPLNLAYSAVMFFVYSLEGLIYLQLQDERG